MGIDELLYLVVGYTLGIISFAAFLFTSLYAKEVPKKPRKRREVKPREAFAPGPKVRTKIVVNDDESVYRKEKGY